MAHIEHANPYIVTLEEFLLMFCFTDSKASLTCVGRKLAK